MLMHVPALPQALMECARVLKPAGAMLVYTTIATGRMEPKEGELPLGDLHPAGKTLPDPLRPAKNCVLVRCEQGNDLLNTSRKIRSNIVTWESYTSTLLQNKILYAILASVGCHAR